MPPEAQRGWRVPSEMIRAMSSAESRLLGLPHSVELRDRVLHKEGVLQAVEVALLQRLPIALEQDREHPCEERSREPTRVRFGNERALRLAWLALRCDTRAHV